MNVEKAEPPALSFILAVGDEVLRLQEQLEAQRQLVILEAASATKAERERDAALELANQACAKADAYRAERDEAVAALVKVTDALARRQS